MRWKKRLVNKVRKIMDSEVEAKEFWGVPHVNNVGSGNKSQEFPACVLSIDLRGSTAILDEHRRRTAVKIYKAFHEVACQVVEQYGGRVRSFDGDGILALWHADSPGDIQQATKAAMAMKDLLRGRAGAAIRKYREVDFGIGLDHGRVHAAKVGPESDSAHVDLVWLGHAVTFAVKLANAAQAPRSLWVSDKVHHNLEDAWKFEHPNRWLFKDSKWEGKEIRYEGQYVTVRRLPDSYRLVEE